MASCAGPIGAASPPARYILSGICRAAGRGCRSEAARVFSWVAMPPAVYAFGVVACCFPPVGAASLVNLLHVLLWFRPSFGFVFGRLRRVSCSRCILYMLALKMPLRAFCAVWRCFCALCPCVARRLMLCCCSGLPGYLLRLCCCGRSSPVVCCFGSCNVIL